MAAASFLSHYLSGPLPYLRRPGPDHELSGPLANEIMPSPLLKIELPSNSRYNLAPFSLRPQAAAYTSLHQPTQPIPACRIIWQHRHRITVNKFVLSASLNKTVPSFLHLLMDTFVLRLKGLITQSAMSRWIDPSWVGHIELFLVPASAPQLV